MNTLWIIPVYFLAFGLVCTAIGSSIGSYKAGKRITALERDVKALKEKSEHNK